MKNKKICLIQFFKRKNNIQISTRWCFLEYVLYLLLFFLSFRIKINFQITKLINSYFLFFLFSVDFRYGSIFKTSLVGKLVIVSGDPEFNQYIFKEEGKSVYCSYTESTLKILGEQSILAYHGVFHKYLKNLTLNMIGPESLREVLLSEIDDLAQKHLHLCSKYPSFDVREESANVS